MLNTLSDSSPDWLPPRLPCKLLSANRPFCDSIKPRNDDPLHGKPSHAPWFCSSPVCCRLPWSFTRPGCPPSPSTWTAAGSRWSRSTGSWRFHPGDSPARPGSRRRSGPRPASTTPAGRCSTAANPGPAQGYPGMSGYGWYRFAVKVPAGEEANLAAVGAIVTSFEVYVDGRLAGGSGQMPPTLIPSTEFRYHLFPLTLSGSASARTVAGGHSRLALAHLGKLRGRRALSSAATWPAIPGCWPTEQQHRQIAPQYSTIVDAYSYSITAGLVGFAIFCLFLIRHAEREYLWFALILLAQAADIALTVGQEIFSWPPGAHLRPAGWCACRPSPSARGLCFFSRVLKARAGLTGRVCLALAAFSPFAAISYWPGWFSAPASGAIQLVCLMPAVVWILSVLVERGRAGKSRCPPAAAAHAARSGLLPGRQSGHRPQPGGMDPTPHVLEVPLPLPPFTMQTGILLHLVFLLAHGGLPHSALHAGAPPRGLAGRRVRGRPPDSAGSAARQLDQSPGFTVECVYQPADAGGRRLLPADRATATAASCWWWATSAARACRRP